MALRGVVSERDLWVGEMSAYSIDGQQVLIARTDDGLHAYVDRCPHLGLPLSAGTLVGNVLTCAAHGYSFDIRSGDGVNPRRACLKRVAVHVADGMICVDGASGERPRDDGR
jgi:toluene monooxygenase system ferredoxin subunit